MKDYIINNIAVKYKTKVTFLIYALILAIITLFVSSTLYDKETTYLSLFLHDYFLWLVFNFGITIINNNELFRISYLTLSRIENKYWRFKANVIIIIISTFIYTMCILVLSMLIQYLFDPNYISVSANVTIYITLRYYLIGLLVQFLIYTSVNLFPVIRKLPVITHALPFIFFLVLTIPYELIASLSDKLIPILDFTASGIFINFSETDVNLTDALFGNLHIIYGVLVTLVLYKWLCLEDEEYYE